MKPELKPCPFCGGDASFDHDDNGWNWIHCKSCDATTNARVSAMDDCKPLLAEAWNRRAPAEPVKVPSDEIVEAVEAYGRAYSMPNTTASELSIRLHEIRALLARYGQPAQPVASVEPRRIGKIIIDATGHPRAQLSTGYDEQGNQWAEGTPIYTAPIAAQPCVPNGWPTKEMVTAFADVFSIRDQKGTFAPAFRAALAAAPSLESPESKENQ